eukprot:3467936-Heterocapsa_arctica.AAC.1
MTISKAPQEPARKLHRQEQPEPEAVDRALHVDARPVPMERHVPARPIPSPATLAGETALKNRKGARWQREP